MNDMNPEQDKSTNGENFRARPFDLGSSSPVEKPWFIVPDVDLDKAVQEGKIQGGDSLLITSYAYTGMGLETYKDTKNGDVREEKLQDLRRRFTEAKTRETDPMDSEIADKYINRLEKKLSEVNPDWNKDELDSIDTDLNEEVALFNRALAAAEGAATSSQSPIRSAQDEEFTAFLQEADDKMSKNQVEVSAQAPLTPLEQTIRDSVLNNGQTNTGTWYRNNSDVIFKLVQEGYLPQQVIEDHKKDFPVENQSKIKTPERNDGKTFLGVQIEYRKILVRLKKESATLSSSEVSALEEEKKQLEAQMDTFEAIARKKNLLNDIDLKQQELESDLILYMADELDPHKRASLEKKIDSWSATDKGAVPAELRGVRATYAEKLRAQMQDLVNASKNSEPAFMKQVKDYTETVIAKRMANIEKQHPEVQRKGFRAMLDELVEATDKGRFDNTINNVMSEILKTADRPNIDADVRAEVRARIHVHACATSIRRVITLEADKVGGEFQRAINEIGDYSLTGNDFETLLQKGLDGLDVNDAFQVLQQAAYRGEFSGKINETEAETKKAQLVTQILNNHRTDPSFDRAAAEKSYDLAMKLAEATFERSVWDTSGGDYLSQAIYFSKWRSKDGSKGPQITVDKIHSLGTSFFRNATDANQKYNEKSLRIINTREWNEVIDLGKSLKSQYRRKDLTSENFKKGRYQSLILQRIQTEQDSVALAEQFYPSDKDVAKRTQFLQQEMRETNPNVTSRPKGMLSFENTNFHQMSATAYKEYLTSTIPAILKAKDLLTKVDINSKDLQNDTNYLGWAETLDRVDPYGVMSLRYWFIAGAMDTALNAGMELSEAARIADHLHKDKMSGKGIFTYLPQYLPDGTSVEHAIKEDTRFFRRGLGNAIINWSEKTIRVRT